jgi:hypothetical protein
MSREMVEGYGFVEFPDGISQEEKINLLSQLPKPETQRIRQFAQGATLNTADEAEAAARASMFGTKYEDELKQIRQKLGVYQKAYPIESTMYELTGAVAPSVAMAPFTGGTSLATAPVQAGPALGRLMAMGAAQGGISGFASGEGGLVDRATRAVGGTVAGGLAAPIAQQAVKAVGGLVGGVIDTVRRRVGDRGAKVVETEIARLTKESGLTPDELVDKIAKGEIMAENATLQDAVRVFARGGGQASTILKKALTERPPALRAQAMNELQNKLAGDLDENVLKSFRAGEKELGALENKLYTEAYAKGGVVNGDMLNAASEALKRAPDSGRSINEFYRSFTGKSPFFKVMDDGEVKWDKMPTLEDMEIIRRGVADAKGRAYTSGSGGVGKNLGDAELALRAQIDNSSLALRDARANVASNRLASESFDAGRKVFTKSADEIQYDFENLVAKSEGATKAFRAGVMDALRSKSSSGAAKTMMQKIEDPMSKEGQVLRTIFPQDELDNMLAIVGRASQSQRAATAVLGGSATAPSIFNANRVGMNISAEEASNALGGNPIAILNVAKKALAKATPTLSDAQRAQVAQVLVSEDPRFVLNALRDQGGIKMLQDRVSQMFGQAQRVLPSAAAITAGSMGGDVSGGLLGR